MLPTQKRLYVAAYHQSPFGKLGALTAPALISEALQGLVRAGNFQMEAVDVGSVAGCLTPLLYDQVLLSGLVASE